MVNHIYDDISSKSNAIDDAINSAMDELLKFYGKDPMLEFAKYIGMPEQIGSYALWDKAEAEAEKKEGIKKALKATIGGYLKGKMAFRAASLKQFAQEIELTSYFDLNEKTGKWDVVDNTNFPSESLAAFVNKHPDYCKALLSGEKPSHPRQDGKSVQAWDIFNLTKAPLRCAIREAIRAELGKHQSQQQAATTAATPSSSNTAETATITPSIVELPTAPKWSKAWRQEKIDNIVAAPVAYATKVKCWFTKIATNFASIIKSKVLPQKSAHKTHHTHQHTHHTPKLSLNPPSAFKSALPMPKPSARKTIATTPQRQSFVDKHLNPTAPPTSIKGPH
jgi:hypothetical protein